MIHLYNSLDFPQFLRDVQQKNVMQHHFSFGGIHRGTREEHDAACNGVFDLVDNFDVEVTEKILGGDEVRSGSIVVVAWGAGGPELVHTILGPAAYNLVLVPGIERVNESVGYP